jgi:hypothetical protein
LIAKPGRKKGQEQEQELFFEIPWLRLRPVVISERGVLPIWRKRQAETLRS